jgi:dihydrofolate reductase
MITIITAMSENGVIGKDGRLPWHIPEELKFFRSQTICKTVVMGRKTAEVIGSLGIRHNVVLSRAEPCALLECGFEHAQLNDVLSWHQEDPSYEIMIIGGAEIYQLFLPYAGRLIISRIHQTIEGDTYFPEINWDEWIQDKVVTDLSDRFTVFFYQRKEDKYEETDFDADVGC